MSKIKQITAEDRKANGLYESSPSISFDSHDLPEVKDWEVGQKYCLCIEVEMTGIHKGDMYGMEGTTNEKKQMITGNFKVTGVGVDDDEEEELSMSEQYEEDFKNRFGQIGQKANPAFIPKMK